MTPDNTGGEVGYLMGLVLGIVLGLAVDLTVVTFWPPHHSGRFFVGFLFFFGIGNACAQAGRIVGRYS